MDVHLVSFFLLLIMLKPCPGISILVNKCLCFSKRDGREVWTCVGVGRGGHWKFFIEVGNLPSQANLNFLNDEFKIHQAEKNSILRKRCSAHWHVTIKGRCKELDQSKSWENRRSVVPATGRLIWAVVCSGSEGVGLPPGRAGLVLSRQWPSTGKSSVPQEQGRDLLSLALKAMISEPK